MKSLNISVARVMPILFGGLLMVSGSYKLVHPGEANYALMSLGAPRLAGAATIAAITALELYLGCILLLRIDVRYALIVSTALMLAFTAFLWYLSTLAHPPACGCLGLTGMFKSTRHDALFGLVRNCLILWGLRLSYDYYSNPLPTAAPRREPA